LARSKKTKKTKPKKPRKTTRAKRKLVSQRAFASQIGVSQSAVCQAIKAGRISTVNGKIDPVAAKREWKSNTDQSKPRNRVTGKPKQRRNPKKPEEPMDLDGASAKEGAGGNSSSYAKARAAREVYTAQLKKLQLERERAALVSADEVRAAMFSLARRTRDELMALPERMSAILAAIDDAAEIDRVLEDEIDRICQEFSNADGF